MARVIIETEGEEVTVGGSNVDVIGTADGSETVNITGGNVTLDASFAQGGDTIMLVGEAESYTATVVGSRIVLTNGTNSISMPLGTEANTVVFGDDDSRTISINAEGEIEFGGQVIDQDGETELDPGNEEVNTLAEALVAYQAAQDSLNEYLEENETTAAEINADLAAAEDDLEDARDIASDARLNANLSDAQQDLADAQEEVADVDGLDEAIADFRAAETAQEDAVRAEVEAGAQLTAETTIYNADPDNVDAGPVDTGLVYVGSGNFDADSATAGIQAGVVLEDINGNNLIEVEADGDLVLSAGVSEATNEGITDLLNALRNDEMADYNLTQANNQLIAADLDTVYTEDAISARDAFVVNGAIAATSAAERYNAALAAYDTAEAGAGATAAQEDDLIASYQALRSAFEETAAPATVIDAQDSDEDNAAAISAADAATQTAITNETNALNAEVTAAQARADSYEVLEQNLEDAEEAVEDAQNDIEDREELVDAFDEASETADELEGYQDDIADAEEMIEDLGYEAPESVDTGAEAATDESDIFVAVGADGTIFDFGEEGDDRLFVGEGYTVVSLDDDDDLTDDEFGSETGLEIFMQQDGDDTVLYIEDEAFSGNEADGSFSGSVIVLADVDMEDVSFDDGFFSIEDSASATFA